MEIIKPYKYSIVKILVILIYILSFSIIIYGFTKFSADKLTYTIPSIVILTLYLLFFYPTLTGLINKSLNYNKYSKIFITIMIFLGIISMIEAIYFNIWISLLFIIFFLAINSILILNYCKDYMSNILFLSIFNQLTFLAFATKAWIKNENPLLLIILDLLILVVITIQQLLLISEFKKTFDGNLPKIKLLSKRTLNYLVRKIIYCEFILFVIPNILNVTSTVISSLTKFNFHLEFEIIIILLTFGILISAIVFLPIKDEKYYFNPKNSNY